MSAFSERVEREDEQDRLVAVAAMLKAREMWEKQSMQLQLVVHDPRCVVCRDYGCEFCPKV